MFPVLPVTLWGWWRTGGQGDRPRREYTGGTTLSLWAGAEHLDAPALPASQVAPEHVALTASELREASAHCGPSRPGLGGPAPADACGSHGGHGPAWWTGGLHAASSGPSGCDWPAAGAAPPQRRARRRRGWRAGGAGPPPPPRPSRRGLSWGPGRRGPGWDRLSPCPTRPGSQPGSGPGTQDSASWGRSRQRGGSPLNIVTRQC